MAGWNLALRFGLEMAALVGIAMGAWGLAPGSTRWPAVVVVPLLAAAAWGTFNVVDDPSRSGEAPVEVGGTVRLAIEVAILGAGAVGFVVAGHIVVAVVFAALPAIHYAASSARLAWLLA